MAKISFSRYNYNHTNGFKKEFPAGTNLVSGTLVSITDTGADIYANDGKNAYLVAEDFVGGLVTPPGVIENEVYTHNLSMVLYPIRPDDALEAWTTGTVAEGSVYEINSTGDGITTTVGTHGAMIMKILKKHETKMLVEFVIV